MGALMRAHDWAGSPLGRPDAWPQSLRSAVGILLPSRAQICLFWGPELAFLYNDPYRPVLGLKHPWALGRPGREVWSEIWGDQLNPLLDQVVERGEAFGSGDHPFVIERYGFPEETYFDISYDPVRDESGAVGGVFCIVSETTGRVVGERRLRTLRQVSEAGAGAGNVEEAVHRVVEAVSVSPQDAPFALIYDQPEGPGRRRCIAATGLEPVDFDRWAAQETGAAAEVVLDADRLADLQPLVAGPWPEPVSKVVRLPILGGQAVVGWLVVGVSPRLRLDDAYLDFLRLLAAHTASAIAAARALEEARARSEALAALDKAKTVFFSNVSHEFRTPLTLMLAPLEQMLRESGVGRDRSLATIAHRNATRLLKLVNALLDFSRIEAGRMQARYAPTDLAAFTAELASSFRSAVESARMALLVDCPPLAEPVFVDREMWETIVLNLVSNAFKFTFEGWIAVRLRAEGASAVLEVADTGTGIAEADLPRLFERFHRVENARGRSFEGTGIGLALIQELAGLHGGEVTVESVLGQGSTFKVRVPLGRAHLPREHVLLETTDAAAGGYRARAAATEALSWLTETGPGPGAADLADGGDLDVARPREGDGRRLLLADDNSDMRDYLARLLRDCGYEVEAVADGEAALAAAIAERPDLVLSDVMMPGLDGIGLLKALRAHRRTAATPVILLSARAGEDAKLEGLQTGADDYLVKPFSARELLGRVAGAIRLAEARADAARAAEEENLRMRRLFEQAPGFIAILSGPDHIYEFANAAYTRLVGDRRVVGRPIRAALPELEGQGYLELLDNVYSTGARHVGREAVVRLQDSPGSPPHDVLLDFVYEPIRGPDGGVSGILVEGYEVTERAAAQAALRANEEQLRLATEAAEVGLWDVDLVNDTLFWPPRVKAMFGISPDEPVSMADFYAGLHPDDREATIAAYEATADPSERALYDVEYRTVGKEDGRIRWVAAKGRGLFDHRGRCVRTIGTAIDITERKAKEARLNELNEILERRIAEVLEERKLLADIVEGTDAFVQVVDADGRWLAINKAAREQFERVTGVRPIVGASVRELLAGLPEIRDRVAANWDRAIAGEEFTQITEYADPVSGPRFYEMKFNTLRDKDGQRIGAYKFVYDVTERLRDQARLAEAEGALRQTQKLEAMGQLTGGVAHDFNNLLTPIIASLDMLQRRGLDGDREQRLVAGAMQSAERARTLVQRLLAFARRQPLQPGPVDVPALLLGMAELVDSTTGPQIKVVVDLAENLPPAKADANQLEMAILNLSVNARDAMEQGGVLSIAADVQAVEGPHRTRLKPGRYVRISVADTGCGMDEATAARAIEPFFSTKGVGKGTGLGLSMVHGLASQLGGALTISSRKGLGTNVELWLPVSREPARPTEIEILDQPHRIAGTVLLVDDEDIVRMTAADMLADMGFSVVEAASAERALTLLAGGLRVDLLITDHLMPGMTGVELAYAVRERWPQTRLLVISGFAEADGLAPDLARVTKPFRQSELNAAIRELGLASQPS